MLHAGERVAMSYGNADSRLCYVESFLGELFLEQSRFETFVFLCDLALDELTHIVCELTHCGTLIGRELTHSAEESGKLALFAEKLNSDLFEVSVRV